MRYPMIKYFQIGAFVLLFAATFAALFIAQRIKATPALIQIRHVSRPLFWPLDPNPRKRFWRLSLQLKKQDRITVGIVDSNGTEIRRLGTAITALRYRPLHFKWDGRTNAGRLASDGAYHARIGLSRQKRSMTIATTIELRRHIARSDWSASETMCCMRNLDRRWDALPQMPSRPWIIAGMATKGEGRARSQ